MYIYHTLFLNIILETLRCNIWDLRVGMFMLLLGCGVATKIITNNTEVSSYGDFSIVLGKHYFKNNNVVLLHRFKHLK